MVKQRSLVLNAYYGNGVIGPSAGDLARWGKPNEAVLPKRELTPAT